MSCHAASVRCCACLVWNRPASQTRAIVTCIGAGLTPSSNRKSCETPDYVCLRTCGMSGVCRPVMCRWSQTGRAGAVFDCTWHRAVVWPRPGKIWNSALRQFVCSGLGGWSGSEGVVGVDQSVWFRACLRFGSAPEKVGRCEWRMGFHDGFGPKLSPSSHTGPYCSVRRWAG